MYLHLINLVIQGEGSASEVSTTVDYYPFFSIFEPTNETLYCGDINDLGAAMLRVEMHIKVVAVSDLACKNWPQDEGFGVR